MLDFGIAAELCKDKKEAALVCVCMEGGSGCLTSLKPEQERRKVLCHGEHHILKIGQIKASKSS